MFAIGRRVLDVQGQRVVVGPWTLAEIEEFGRATDIEEQVVIFGSHVEESPWPRDEMGYLAAIAVAWTAEVNAAGAMIRPPRQN